MTKLLNSGAFPTSNLVDGQPFFRSDLGMMCYYDLSNTRWLSELHHMDMNETNISSGGNFGRVLTRTYAIWVVTYSMTYTVATTNDGSNYWSMIFNSRTKTRSATTAVKSINTSSGVTAGTTYNDTGTPTTQAPANYGLLEVTTSKTGSPGNLTLYGTLDFRYIIT